MLRVARALRYELRVKAKSATFRLSSAASPLLGSISSHEKQRDRATNYRNVTRYNTSFRLSSTTSPPLGSALIFSSHEKQRDRATNYCNVTRNNTSFQLSSAASSPLDSCFNLFRVTRSNAPEQRITVMLPGTTPLFGSRA